MCARVPATRIRACTTQHLQQAGRELYAGKLGSADRIYNSADYCMIIEHYDARGLPIQSYQ